MEKVYEYQLDVESDIAPARLVRMVGRNKSVLEIGCSTGASSRAMRDEMDCRVTGVEIFEQAAAVARQYCEQVIVGNVETLDLADVLQGRRFDVITFGDVLEHLRDPLATLVKVMPLLTVDGHVVISVPNITHFSIAFELLNGRFDYRDKGLLDDTHIRFFTAKSLLKMLDAARLEPLAIERVVVEPEETEINTILFGPEHSAIFEYARKSNPELLTYQFVVKARPLSADPMTSGALIETRESESDLKVLLARSERRTAVLQSQVDWLESRPFVKLLRQLSQVLRRRA